MVKYAMSHIIQCTCTVIGIEVLIKQSQSMSIVNSCPGSDAVNGSKS